MYEFQQTPSKKQPILTPPSSPKRRGYVANADDDSTTKSRIFGGRTCDTLAVASLLFFGALFGYVADEYARGGGGFRPIKGMRGGVVTPTADPDALFSVEEVDESDGSSDTNEDEVGSRPPLSDLIANDHRVKADVSWLLNFAVIGNAKSGTTFLKNYLGKFDEIYMNPNEICKMGNNRTDQVVKFFHNHLEDVDAPGKYAYTEDGRRIKTGLKCPKEVGTRDALRNYATHFPRTNFIVSVRHPVLWFQSFYNYRSYGGYPKKLPPPTELIGSCQDNGSPYVCPRRCGHIRTENVCTDRAKFHHQLARFGKTPMQSREEKRLLRDDDMEVVPVRTKIFLAELRQFIPTNPASERIAEDLSAFLGLERQLPSLQEFGGHKRSYSDEERQSNFIDICDEEHREVREMLVDIGRDAAEWIRDYFLESPDVVVSSRELFVELIEEWGHDPCSTEYEMHTSH